MAETDRKPTIRDRVEQAQHWFARRLPAGLRLPVGLLLMAMGSVGFLPIFGFWMLPLGAAVAWLDIKPVWRRYRAMRRKARKRDPDEGGS